MTPSWTETRSRHRKIGDEKPTFQYESYVAIASPQTPPYADIASWGVGSFEVDLMPALHHERDMLKGRYILQRIACNSDDIGVLADLQ